jgi:hypothetical protein
MLMAPRPEPVRKILKVLFPDLVENLHHGTLDDFILQRRNPQRALPPAGFRYPALRSP